MSEVWESDLPATERLIMLCLADHADDSGECYPSIQRLQDRTGLSERAVQNNLRKLVASGHLEVQEGGGRGRANLYVVHAKPRTKNPVLDAPRTRNPVSGDVNPAPRALNPAPDAPEPLRTVIEPSSKKEGDKVRGALEAWASPDAVTSFMAYRRKQKGKALTVTAAKRLANNLKEIFNAGGDPDDALGLAEERGWQSVEPEWYFKSRGRSNSGSGTVDAFAAVAARLERKAGGGYGG